MKITRKACEELIKAPPAIGRVTHWDDTLAGFGIRVSKSGHLSFLVKYRVKGDPAQRVVTLGDYPALAPDKARSRAAEIKADAGLGRDAVAERAAELERALEERREAERRRISLAALLDLWRENTEAAAQVKVARRESVDYERMLLRLEGKVLRPAIGQETVGSLDPGRFQATIDLQTSRSVGNNVRALIVRFNRLANAELARRGIPVKWPTKFELQGKARSRTERFTLTQAARLWIGAGTLGRRGALVRFMLLTGCRRIEAQKVEWAHITLDDEVIGPFWQQPSHLTKNHQPHRVPLSAPAVALLRWLPRRPVPGAEPALIFAGRGGKAVGSWTLVMACLRAAAGLETGTLHDFRRTVVSTLGDHGFDPQVADQLLNHAAANSMGGVMGVYQRSEFWQKRREAIDRWTDLLMEAVAREKKQPAGPGIWGFTEPFKDARLVMSKPQRAGNARPARSSTKRSASAQASNSLRR